LKSALTSLPDNFSRGNSANLKFTRFIDLQFQTVDLAPTTTMKTVDRRLWHFPPHSEHNNGQQQKQHAKSKKALSLAMFQMKANTVAYRWYR